MPLLHPARILRGGWALEPAQRETLLRVRESLADLEAGRTPRYWLDTSTPPTGAILQPRLEDLHDFATGDLSKGVAIDLECAGDVLVGLGFCRVADLVPIWCPFRRKGGGQYWGSVREVTGAVEWCQGLLTGPWLKVWHNGLCFDIPYLEEQGFRVEGPHLDTILLSHVHMPEMPKALQYRATYHLGLPSWKQLSEVDEEMDK